MKKALSQINNLPRIIRYSLFIFLVIYIPLWFLTINISKNQNISNVLPVLGSDSFEYRTLAENILNNKSFTLDGVKKEVFRSPGYPFFVYIFLFIFNSLFSATFFQIILTFLTALIIFKISNFYLNEKISLIPAILYLLEPGVILHTLLLLSDIPFVFLITLSVYLLLHSEKRKKPFFIGILIGLATLFRPIAMFLPLLYSLFYVHEYYFDYRVLIKRVGIFILGFVLIITPWSLRNYYHFKSLTISSVSSYNFIYYNIPMYLSYKNGISVDQVRKEFFTDNLIDNMDLMSPKSSERINKVSKDFLKNNFIGYLKYHILSTKSFIFGSNIKVSLQSYNLLYESDEDFAFPNQNKFINISVLLERSLWLLFFVLSIGSLFIKKYRPSLVFLFVLILYFLILTGPVSYARYRLPVEPFLFTLAILVFSYIIDIYNRQPK